jgi:hypothetical protein
MSNFSITRLNVRDYFKSLDISKKHFNNLTFTLLILLNNNEKFVRIRSVVFKRR